MRTQVVIGIAISFLLLLLIIRNVYFVEAFEDSSSSSCSKLTAKDGCQARQDCLYDEKTSKCLSCSDISDCKTCADSEKCGWCGDIVKCVLLNRFGTPVGRECSAQRTVRFSQQCESKNPGFDMPVNSELLDTQEAAAIATEISSAPPLTRHSCPSSEKVAEIAKKKIEDSIKTLVRTELKALGVSIKEGFTADEDISKMVVSSMTDDIRKLVKDSVNSSKPKA